jgi:hypothetical protein
MTPNKLPFVTDEDLQSLLKDYIPTIYQYIESVYDFICGINFGYSLPFDPRPPLYHWAVEDDDFFYLGYAVYHYQDTASLHRHDLESILLQIDKETHYITRQCTVSHLDLIFTYPLNQDDDATFIIEEKGHGIRSLQQHGFDLSKNSIMYINFDTSYRFNLKHIWNTNVWEQLQKQFGNTVNLPDRYVDMSVKGIEAYIKAKNPIIEGERVRTSRGWFWNRPDLLFKYAEKLKRFEEV